MRCSASHTHVLSPEGSPFPCSLIIILRVWTLGALWGGTSIVWGENADQTNCSPMCLRGGERWTGLGLAPPALGIGISHMPTCQLVSIVSSSDAPWHAHSDMSASVAGACFFLGVFFVTDLRNILVLSFCLIFPSQYLGGMLNCLSSKHLGSNGKETLVILISCPSRPYVCPGFNIPI